MASGRETGRASLGAGVGSNYCIAQAFATLGELWGSILGHATYRDVTDNVQYTDVSSRVEYADKTEAVKHRIVS